MSGRGVALVGGLVALGGWLAGSLGFWRGPSPAPGTTPVVEAPAIAESAASVRTGVDRLLARPVEPPPLSPPTRNPFRFSERQPAPKSSATAGSGRYAPPAAADTTPSLRLIGLAEDSGPGGPQRTAIVSGLDQLFFLKAGDSFGGHFRVVTVGADSVRVEDTTTGAILTLAMR